MLRPIDQFFQQQPEPARSCLIFLRQHLLDLDKNMTEAWKYGMPFYSYKGKIFCYLWFHKKYQQPYIGFVAGSVLSHPELLQEKRARMKILLIDPAKDIPLAKIDGLLRTLLLFYKKNIQ